MALKRWTRFIAPLGSLALAVALHDTPTRACGFFGPSPDDFMTFDPAITGDPDGLFFNEGVLGMGETCTECATKAMLGDWHGYLKGKVSDADWKKVLLPEDNNQAIPARAKLENKGDRVKDALAFVDLAHRVEPFASVSADTRPNGALLADAQAAMKAARDPFLAQRYAFQVLRIMFYQHDWAAAVAFYDKSSAQLAGPSADLAWRARYYMAGAAKRSSNRARANLELARIHTSYPPLANVAAEDFKPMEDADWKESLALATNVREKTALWRLVGVRTDGLVAMQEIVKLDPKSNLLALLLVRELARAEPLGAPVWGSTPDPKEVAAQKKAFTAIAKVAEKIAATPGADRPWIAELVLGHIAARRGDLDGARAHLDKAVQLRPSDSKVVNQAKASLSIALAQNYKVDAAHETELANTMNAIDPKFGKIGAVRDDVRARLAKQYAKAGRYVDAEWLAPGTTDAENKWRDKTFIEQMIARGEQAGTEFDKLVLTGSFQRPALENELAVRELMNGEFAAAAQAFQGKAHSEQLHVDPFVIHINDCHECDQEKYQNAKWTHASLAAKLVELEKAANGTGEPAAKAAIDLGNAMYNVTWFGNARVFAENTHQRSGDTRPAEAWYKRAYDLSKNRETKAKAAWLAAKSELGRLEKVDVDAPWGIDGQNVPMPKKWFGVMKTLADTKYYKEALAECSRFRTYLGH